MSKTDTPRYTGVGRPIYHQHGSRRALVEQQSKREAIWESLADDPTIVLLNPDTPAK